MNGFRSPKPQVCTLVLAVMLGFAACAGHRVLEPPPEELSWPLDDPHVRLAGIVERQTHSGLGRVFSWIAGERPGPLFVRPYGVGWLGDDLLVTDPGARRVVRVGTDGHTRFSGEGLFDGPIGVAVCEDGIVVTDSVMGRAALLDDELKLIDWLAEDLIRPTAVACAGDHIYVVETGRHRLLVRDAGGTWSPFGLRGEDPGEFNFPTAVALDRDSLWVGDTLNFRVQRLNRTNGGLDAGDEFGQLGDSSGAMPRLKGMAIDASGHLWVSDAWLNQVSLYTRSGDLLMSLGGAGSAPGRFNFPAGIAAHGDGRVAVVDAQNRRVQVFELLDEAEEP